MELCSRPPASRCLSIDRTTNYPFWKGPTLHAVVALLTTGKAKRPRKTVDWARASRPRVGTTRRRRARRGRPAVREASGTRWLVSRRFMALCSTGAARRGAAGAKCRSRRVSGIHGHKPSVAIMVRVSRIAEIVAPRAPTNVAGALSRHPPPGTHARTTYASLAHGAVHVGGQEDPFPWRFAVRRLTAPASLCGWERSKGPMTL